MPMKPLDITEIDIQRARRIERSWAPQDLSEVQAEYVVRAIAQGRAVSKGWNWRKLRSTEHPRSKAATNSLRQ
jgi:alkyl hydroperoxide reductase subunit AhpF